MRSSLVVITTKQRAERIRSITVSIAASATGGICEIIPTRLDGCWRNIAIALNDQRSKRVIAWLQQLHLTTLRNLPSPNADSANYRHNFVFMGGGTWG